MLPELPSLHSLELSHGVSAKTKMKCSRETCDPLDYSPPGSSVQGIFQTRFLEQVVISYPGDLHNPGIEPASLALAGRFLTTAPITATPIYLPSNTA